MDIKDKVFRIFFTGVGGQGTLLATRLVGEAALEEGLPVLMSEIHGMVQRGGVVESSVVIEDQMDPGHVIAGWVSGGQIKLRDARGCRMLLTRR